MLRTLFTLLKFAFYALLVVIGVTFAVQNRSKVDVSLFPLPYVFEAPLFLIAIFTFALGSLLGWSIAHRGGREHRRGHREAGKRVAALENELSARRSEQVHKPAILPPK